MLKYNICFIQRNNEILLLNREKPSWMGCWNGVGGKLERDETPRDSMIREIFEETGLQDYELEFRGLITWVVEGERTGGMYTYLATLSSESLATPVETEEGILDWKTISWIMNPDNVGIAHYIPKCLDQLLNGKKCCDFCCTYEQGNLISVESTIMPSTGEENYESCYF